MENTEAKNMPNGRTLMMILGNSHKCKLSFWFLCSNNKEILILNITKIQLQQRAYIEV